MPRVVLVEDDPSVRDGVEMGLQPARARDPRHRDGRGRPGGAGRVPPRPAAARSDAAGDGRCRGVPPGTYDQPVADHHAHRARRRRGHRRRPGGGCGRLRRQTRPHRGHRGPHPCRAAPHRSPGRCAARRRTPRRPGHRPGRSHRPEVGRAGRPRPFGAEGAAVPFRGAGKGLQQAAAPGRGLGPQLPQRRAPGGRLRAPTADQDRGPVRQPSVHSDPAGFGYRFGPL